MLSALDEVVYDLVHTTREWISPPLPGMGAQSTARRVKGAAFSCLVMLDGDSGPGAVALRRKGGGEVEPGGLHEIRSDQADDPEARRLLEEVERWVRLCSVAYRDARRAVPAFVKQFCRLLAADYELRLVRAHGDADESDDLAPALPDAFSRAWARQAVS